MTEPQGKALLRYRHANFTRTTLQFAQSNLHQLHYNAQRLSVGLFGNHAFYERHDRLAFIW